MVREFVDCTFLIFTYSGEKKFDPVILVALTAHDSLVSAPRVVCWGYIIIIIIIFIINRHELHLDRPVSAPSSSFFKGLVSFLRPFGL
jgi:hypothetical protein